MMRAVWFLVLALPLSAQMTVVNEAAGGGGASAVNDLSDVTITPPRASGDILVDNGSDVYVNEQILEAIGSRLPTTACVAYESSGVLTCESNFKYLQGSDTLQVGTGLRVNLSADGNTGVMANRNATLPVELRGGTSTSSDATRWLLGGSGDLTARFYALDNQLFQIGGSQTALVQDQTATTGDTSFIVKAGAGQSSNLQEWQNSSGTSLAYFNVNGSLYAASLANTGNDYLFTATRAEFASDYVLAWVNNTNLTIGARDIGLERQAAGILEVTNGSTGLGYLKAGSFDLEDGGTKPTCDSSTRGYAWNDEGGAGVADVIERCVKDDDDAYYWKPELNDIVAVNIDLDDAMVASTGDGKYYFFIDASLNGYDLTDVSLSNDVPGTTSGTLTIDLARCTIGAAICSTEAAILTTKLSVDYDEFSSLTAASAAVINTSNNAVSTGQRIRIDVDAIAGGTAATDVKIGLVFTKRS
jgi:hypothetical protein